MSRFQVYRLASILFSNYDICVVVVSEKEEEELNQVWVYYQ